METASAADSRSAVMTTSSRLDAVEWIIQKPLAAENKAALDSYLCGLLPCEVSSRVDEAGRVGYLWKITLTVSVPRMHVHRTGTNKCIRFSFELLSKPEDAIRVRVGVEYLGQMYRFSEWVAVGEADVAELEIDGKCIISSPFPDIDFDLFKDHLWQSSQCLLKFHFEYQLTNVCQLRLKNSAAFVASSLGSRILANLKLSDLTVISADEHKFPAHKLILAAQSPVFERMFAAEMTEKENKVLKLEDFEVGSVKCFMAYLYGEKIDPNCLNVDIMLDLLILGDKYGIPELKQLAEDQLPDFMEVECVCQAVVVADLHLLDGLKKCCINFIVRNRTEVTKSDAWKEFKDKHVGLYVEVLEAIADI